VPRLRVASPYLLAALLTIAGAAHFLFPEPFDRIIPGFVPGPPRFWTYASGVVEWACAAGLVPAATRRRAATSTAVLFVAVFPANIDQAVHTHGAGRWLALARLPLQVPLVLWALRLRRTTAAPLANAASGR
jgi:uncharacterized membrane protein